MNRESKQEQGGGKRGGGEEEMKEGRKEGREEESWGWLESTGLQGLYSCMRAKWVMGQIGQVNYTYW